MKVPSLTEEDWSKLGDTYVDSIISTGDKPIRFMLIYKIYYSPVRLRYMGMVSHSQCPLLLLL